MKKLLLIAAAFLGISNGYAFAACTSPAVMHDFPGTSFNMSLGTNSADGNCISINAIASWGGVQLGAATAYGTAPTGIVPGVNAFVTNPVAVTGTFWQATQPVSGTFWQTTQPISAASGAAVDGWDVTKGAKTDPVATLPASTASASGISLWKAIANSLNSLLSAATTPLNNSSVPINVSTATTTQLVALSGSTVIYVTSYDVIAGGTGNITFEYGTGTNCGTGTTALTGAYNLTAQAGIAKGSGIGTVLKVPAGNALCVLTSAAVQMSGSVSYQQF